MSTAWADLQQALRSNDPACAGDPRFTSETGEHDADLREICAGCPVQQQCADYARTAPRNSTWGYFSGIVRRTNPQVRIRRSGGTT